MAGAPMIVPKDLGRPALDPDRVRALRLEIRLGRLPRDVGIVLVSVGAVGLVIPGPLPPGMTFLAVGTIVLSPRLLRPFAGPLRRRFPLLYRAFEMQVSRFEADLQGRYPGSTRRGGKGASSRR